MACVALAAEQQNSRLLLLEDDAAIKDVVFLDLWNVSDALAGLVANIHDALHPVLCLGVDCSILFTAKHPITRFRRKAFDADA